MTMQKNRSGSLLGGKTHDKRTRKKNSFQRCSPGIDQAREARGTNRNEAEEKNRGSS